MFHVMCIALMALGLLGAYCTRLMTQGHPFAAACVIIIAMLSAQLWIGMVTSSNQKHAILTIIFDVVYGLSYFVGFLILGDKLSAIQLAGVALTFAGLILLNF